MKAPIRILFNDSRNNLPGSKYIANGGPARFADLFTSYFKTTPHHLISVFFSYNGENSNIELRTIASKKQQDYIEVIYPRKKLSGEYKKDYKKKAFLQFLSPWLEQVEKLFDQALPDVVFLNGYSLTNYLLFAVAKKKGVPVCIQHAGLWVKEVTMASGSAFSPSVAKIFIAFEKELITHTTHHMFLNTFSMEQFLTLHKISKQDLHEWSIVPLPIPVPKKIVPFTLLPKSSRNMAIGSVARWDAIKNHSALLRLAEYAKENSLPETVSVVTEPFNGIQSEFRDRYAAAVTVVPSMDPKKLSSFYSSCDVIILPSLFDVSPTVVMEATLLGKPVIISNQVGWVSAYTSGGLLPLVISPAASGKEIQDVIDILFTYPERFLKRLTAFQNRVVKNHLPQYVFPKYEKIFINLSKKYHG
jgi:glycosyltransferase involved in cell wall biosynthesis